MARYNPDLMSLDDGQGTRRVFGTQTETPKITQAEMTAASIAAAKELAMTPYTELTPEERKSMTQAEKTAYIKAARDEKNAIDAEERAATNPMFDFTNRPDAPKDATGNFINYYSWQGDTNSGEWRLYRAANTPTNQATYGSRAVGGPTQAMPGNPKGANALASQPQPIKDSTGNVIGWTSDDSGTTLNGTAETGFSTNESGDTTGFKTVNGVLTLNGKVYTGNFNGKAFIDGKVATPVVDNSKVVDNTSSSSFVSGSTTTLPPGVTVTTTYVDPRTGDTVGVLSNGTTKVLSAGNTLQANRVSTMNTLIDRFNKYGLSSLANKIKELAIDGATESTVTLQLQETPEYQQRFSANAARIKQGLQVLNPAEYLSLEDGYRQVLRAYGLKAFDTDAYVQQFIANDVSAAELSNRVVTAVQRVQNADPAIQKQLRDYYGIGTTDLVAYVLDPQQQFQKIERQVAAAEIGVAAGRQGLKPGVAVAEQLAAQGVSQAEAQKGYATIADILPTAEKLSSIYGKTMDTYGQSEAEQEVFNSLASAQRKREKLTAREQAAFSGAAGTNKTSLTTSAVGQFQNPERTYRPRQRNRPIVGASQFPRTELWPAN